MQALLLAGNAYAAKILYGYLAHDERYKIVACVVDDAYKDKAKFTAVPSVGLSDVAQHYPPDEVHVLMACGYGGVNAVRARLYADLTAAHYTMETYVHERATVLTDKIGAGSVLMPGALVEPGASVGCDCFLWGNTVVAHDATLGDHCWLAAGAVVSGMAKVGDKTFIGVNATISNGVVLGASNIVGGSAFMTKNTKDNMVYLARSGEPFRATAEEYAKYFGF